MKYADSGVNIDAATRALAASKTAVRSTWDERVKSELGSFGGLFQAAPGEPLLVASVDGVGTKVKIVARVPSHWVGALQGLDGFDFTIDPHQPPRRAKLYSIDPVVQEASRSFEVIGTAPAEGLKPGMFANVTLESPEIVQSLWLPVAAILTSDTPKVYMALDGRIAVRRIQTGLRDDGMIEVVSGIAEGERVISDVAGLSRDLPVEVVR